MTHFAMVLWMGGGTAWAEAPPVDTTSPTVQPAAPIKRFARRNVVPPLRFGFRAGLRPTLNTSLVLSLGVQLHRFERAKLEGNLSYALPHNLGIPGPWRNLQSVDNTYDLLFLPSPGLEIGPTVGISYRTYSQQWSWIGAHVVPIAGARVSVPLILGGRFSWSIDARLTADLALTEFVVDTQEIRMMHPLELQLGTQFNFGQGRPKSQVAR